MKCNNFYKDVLIDFNMVDSKGINFGLKKGLVLNGVNSIETKISRGKDGSSKWFPNFPVYVFSGGMPLICGKREYLFFGINSFYDPKPILNASSVSEFRKLPGVVIDSVNFSSEYLKMDLESENIPLKRLNHKDFLRTANFFRTNIGIASFLREFDLFYSLHRENC